MWHKLGQFIIRFRLPLLLILFICTAIAAWYASQVQMSYEFAKAIPANNQRYKDYLSFKEKFGDDGNTLVLGLESQDFYTPEIFNAVAALQQSLKKVPGTEDILSIPQASNLIRDSASEKLITSKIFHAPYTQQNILDSDRAVFENLPFYNASLYNKNANAYLMVLRLNKDTINSKARTRLINEIAAQVKNFEINSGITVHVSGLPFIRTTIANRIAKEMNWFLIASLLLSAITLVLFFRSFSATIMSLLVVGMGVVWSLATMVLLGYKITLLTALIPPLIVVIGIPNCIYFLNKYHTAYLEKGDKKNALHEMVGRMGVVTLFCNIAAAVGFAVFAFTKSALLEEFGIVAGINIMALFIISIIFIPAVLSYLPAPKKSQTKYLDSKIIESLLLKIEKWVIHHARAVYIVTALLLAVSIMGIFRLKSEGFIVDDLPQNDIVYTDLKWFEHKFNGIMPLEIMIETKRKNGLLRSLAPIEAINEFEQYIDDNTVTARPLSFVDGLKFARQAFYDGDSVSYATPTEFDMPVLGNYLKQDKKDSAENGLAKTLKSFIDSNRQTARISVNMKDIGSAKLPALLADFDSTARNIFDTANYKVTLTGASVTFLEGSNFIINGLKESIFWAFLLIALCMFYLFRSARILICSLIPNVVPLVITAGIMGWAGISLKPSTVLIFSIALGIAIDITIRFLVNYKQELPLYKYQVQETVVQTIHHTGISIVYTSLVLVAGFIIFCISNFGGTKALGWLTSFTLITSALTNLILLPVLLKHFAKHKAIVK